jgi:hypothetical protein
MRYGEVVKATIKRRLVYNVSRYLSGTVRFILLPTLFDV